LATEVLGINGLSLAMGVAYRQRCVILILVPYMNRVAVLAGARMALHYGGNLNRTFPLRLDSVVGKFIVNYFQRCLQPMADF
jgi:predicted deacylase